MTGLRHLIHLVSLLSECFHSDASDWLTPTPPRLYDWSSQILAIIHPWLTGMG